MPSSRRRAFTYVELTLVATIIAILAAIAVPNFLEAKVRAAVARSKAELALLKMGIEAYRLENRIYPLNAAPGRPDPYDLVALTTPVAYLPSLPADTFTTPEMIGQQGQAPRMSPEPYGYYNAYQVNGEAGFRFVGADTYVFPGYVAALVWGRGPRTGTRPLPDPATVLSPDGAAAIVPYDPTNGTTSRGDIFMTLP